MSLVWAVVTTVLAVIALLVAGAIADALVTKLERIARAIEDQTDVCKNMRSDHTRFQDYVRSRDAADRAWRDAAVHKANMAKRRRPK